MTPVSIDTAQTETEPVSIDVNSSQANPVSPELASILAAKAHLGLAQNWDKTFKDIYDGMIGGNEDMLRAEAAAVQARIDGEKKNKLIMAAVQNNNWNLDRNLLSEIDKVLPPTSPKSVFEKKYSEHVVGELDRFAQRDGDTFWNTAYKEIPVITERSAQLGKGLLATTELAKRIQADAEENLHKQGWGSWTVDLLKDLATGGLYSEGKLRGLAPGTGFFSGLLGSNMNQATRELLALPEGQREERIYAIYNKLKQDNPTLALTFANALVGQSSSDVFLDNVLSAFNLSIIPGLAKLGAKGVKNIALTHEVNGAVKDIIKNAGKNTVDGVPTKASLAEAVGDLGEAAVQRTADDIFVGTNEPYRRALQDLPSALKVDDLKNIEANPGRLSTGIYNILRDDTLSFSDRMMQTLEYMQKVQRIPLREAGEQFIRQLKDNAKSLYPGLRNAILDVSNPVLEPFSNTFNFDIKVGNHTGLLFSTLDNAHGFMDLHGLQNVGRVEVDRKMLERTGLGYYIRINAPLRETDDMVRDLFGKTALTAAPKGGLIKSALSWLRTPEDTMSQLERINRKVVTYAQAQMRQLADEERQFIQKIKDGGTTYKYVEGTLNRSNKQRWEDLDRVLLNAQEMKDPATGRPGYFFQSPLELEEFYQFVFKRMPDEDEVRAYFAHKRLHELDRVIRTLELYRAKTRLGTEAHTIFTLGADGSRMSSKQFEGIVREELPGGSDPIVMIGDIIGAERVFRDASAISKNLKKEINNRIKQGLLKVIEIYDPDARPLAEFGKKIETRRVRYVIAPNVETKPLSWTDQVPRVGGGHFEYDYPFFIKVARIAKENYGKVFRNIYDGDTTVMPIATRAQGIELIDKMNQVRTLIAAKDLAGAKAKLLELKLPIEWKEFISWYRPKRVNGVRVPALLNEREPFEVVPNGDLIHNMHKGLEERYGDTFVDGTRRGSLARQNQVAFTQERDAFEMFTINNEGTKHNPLYKHVPAQKVDPILMLNRALSRVINSNLMDDYKMFAVENWIRDAEQHLTASPSELKYAPLKFFYKPDFKSSAPTEEVYRLKSNHFKIMQFLGQPSYVDTFMQSMTQKIADQMYDKIGPKAALVPQWLLPKISDPVSFIRGMVYHMTLGLFAVPQLVVQNMTYVTIAALSPQHAIAGASGAFFHQWSRINPRMVDTLDNYVTKLKIPGLPHWKPGEWKEAYNELQKTGFFHVGGEYVNLDQISNYKVVTNAGQKFLDWGQVFFREGERNVRLGAWYTAFKEFRTANPTGRITELDRAQILEKADMYTTNMSRASASAMHTGVFSLTSQFLSYQMRLAELFFSKRLGDTVGERAMARARLLGFYSAAFGIPTAMGVTGAPVAEYIRKKGFENGYVVGENFATTLAMEGIPSMLANYMTDNWYNIPSRFGSQGFEQIKEALRGDQPWWNLIGGAAFSKFSSMFEASNGLATAIMQNIRGEGQFSVKPEDFIDPLKEIQSINATWHAIAAINTGRWMSKKEYDLGKTSPLNAVVMSALGLQPLAVEDAFTKQWSIKDRENLQKLAEQRFVREFRRSMQSALDKDHNQSSEYMKRAFTWLRLADYPEENWGKVIGIAADRSRDMITRIDDTFYLKNVPQTQKPTMNEAFTKTLQGRN